MTATRTANPDLSALDDRELRRLADRLSFEGRSDPSVRPDLEAAETEIARRQTERSRSDAAGREEQRRAEEAAAKAAETERARLAKKLIALGTKRLRNAERFEDALQRLADALATEQRLAGESADTARSLGFDGNGLLARLVAPSRVAVVLADSAPGADFSRPLSTGRWREATLPELLRPIVQPSKKEA